MFDVADFHIYFCLGKKDIFFNSDIIFSFFQKMAKRITSIDNGLKYLFRNARICDFLVDNSSKNIFASYLQINGRNSVKCSIILLGKRENCY